MSTPSCPPINLLAIVTLVAAVLLLVTAFLRRGWRAILGVVALWIAVAVIAGAIYPSFVQRFQVSPNELTLERPFIEDNIASRGWPTTWTRSTCAATTLRSS